LNLTTTIAVTQNFVSGRNFDESWRKTRTGRKKMAGRLLFRLERHFPALYARARELNELDNFVLKDDWIHHPNCSADSRKKHKSKGRRRKRSIDYATSNKRCDKRRR